MISLESLVAEAVDQKCKALEGRATAAEEQSRLLADRLCNVEKSLLNQNQPNDGVDTSEEKIILHREDYLSQENSKRINDRITALEEEFVHHLNKEYDEMYELPEDTFSMLMTENFLSAPFVFGIFSTALSVLCLGLAVVSSIAKGNETNPLGVPQGVSNVVHTAQFAGLIVGVFSEDEIPEGLQLMALAMSTAEQDYGQRTKSIRFKRRIIIVSLLRICVGYLFLFALFVNVVQNDEVLQTFFDLLALDFVEKIDNMAYSLGKRGFFGKTIMLSAIQSHKVGVCRRGVASREWPYRVARAVYFLNAALLMAGMAIITINQNDGLYRCPSVTFDIGEDMWERAHVILKDSNSDVTEEKLLIYSYFSGVYKENGTHDGYPKYTEQNKVDDKGFESTVGAEFVYCKDLGSWVFRHPLIKTSRNSIEENECSWLLRSPTTISYDIADVASSENWNVWKGTIDSSSRLSASCNECRHKADCSYNGQCVNRGCQCDKGYFGHACHLETPCESLAVEKKGSIGWHSDPPILLANTSDDTEAFLKVYARPVYVQKNVSGIPYDLLKFDRNSSGSIWYDPDREADFADWDDFFEYPSLHDNLELLIEDEYSIHISFTGSRWYGTIFPANVTISEHFHRDYHAFWDDALSENRTFIVSDSTSESSPLDVDWFEMRRRINYRLQDIVDNAYGPIGVLIPLLPYKGGGWFHCLLKNEPTFSPTSYPPTVTTSPSQLINSTL